MTMNEAKHDDEEQQPLLPKSRNHKTELYGLGILILSSFTSALMSFFIKLGGSYSIPSSEIVAIQAVVEIILISSACAWKDVNPLGPPQVRWWLVLFGITGGTMTVIEAYCTTQMPLADFTVILQLNPLFTSILAALFLNESFRYSHGACIALCITGTIFVVKPPFLFGHSQQLSLIPAFGVILSAFLTASLCIIVRRIGSQAYFLVFNMYFTVCSLIIALPSIGSFVWPQGWKPYLSLLMAGTCMFFNGAMINRGIQMAPAAPGSIVRMSRIVFATLLGIFIFHEYPDELSLFGATMISVGTGILMFIASWKRK